MYYKLYEMSHAALAPWRAVADATRLFYSHPVNPASHTHFGKQMAATAELFERTTRRYGKPEFGIARTSYKGMPVTVSEEIVWERPFCKLIHFARALPANAEPARKLLIVAPMSGHYATLLRGTVQTMSQYADVYITDWIDARMVPLASGSFDLDDYIDYVIEILHHLGENTHVMAVCQPSVPVLAAVAVMEGRGDPFAPASMTLMGGPIDTRENPTAVNKLAESRGIDWFRDNVVMPVPFPASGLHAAGLSRLPAAFRLHVDEPRPAHRRPPGILRPPRQGRWRQRREAPRFLRRIHGGDGPRRRLLSPDRRYGLRAPLAAKGRDAASRRAGRLLENPQYRADDRRGRERRHFRPAADTRGAQACHRTFRTTSASTTCSPRSGITVSSTARASAQRSPRASSTSWRATTASAPRRRQG